MAHDPIVGTASGLRRSGHNAVAGTLPFRAAAGPLFSLPQVPESAARALVALAERRIVAGPYRLKLRADVAPSRSPVRGVARHVPVSWIGGSVITEDFDGGEI